MKIQGSLLVSIAIGKRFRRENLALSRGVSIEGRRWLHI